MPSCRARSKSWTEPTTIFETCSKARRSAPYFRSDLARRNPVDQRRAEHRQCRVAEQGRRAGPNQRRSSKPVRKHADRHRISDRTSREETQSINEELNTVNAELQSKVEELDRTNDDLRNLFESTPIGTVFQIGPRAKKPSRSTKS